MQFGLDTKHWKIPFVYFVTIVLSWRRKLHGSMMPCDTWLLYCQVQKIFYWFDQCTTLVVDSLIITNCKHYIRHICLLWKMDFVTGLYNVFELGACFFFSISMCLLWNLFYLHFHFQLNRTSRYMELDCQSCDVEAICN